MNNNRSSGRILYYLNKFRSFYIDGAFNYVDGRDVADIIYSLYKSNLFGEKFIANAGCITFKTLGEKIAGLRGYSPPTIRISDTLLKVLALSSGKSMPAKSMDIIGQNRTFQNKKVRNILNFEFQPIDATLRWCCNMP